jgi:hypothetical protein
MIYAEKDIFVINSSIGEISFNKMKSTIRLSSFRAEKHQARYPMMPSVIVIFIRNR